MYARLYKNAQDLLHSDGRLAKRIPQAILRDKRQTCLVGTIDKAYPRKNLGYAFEISEPAFSRILERGKVDTTNKDHRHGIVTVCKKDSQDINEDDRVNEN